MANLNLTETVLCGAPGALQISQISIDDISPYLGSIDAAGYYSCEVMDRDLFFNTVTYLREDPWERIRTIKKGLPNTRLQVSFAGSYLWGDEIYDNSIIEFFIHCLAKNNVDIIRIYDPLNDINNLKKTIQFARSQNLHVQCSLIYTTSDIHSNSTFISYAKGLVDAGADSICVEDVGEELNPYSTYNLIAALKTEVDVPIQFKTSNSAGSGYMNTLKAVEAGINILDTALSSFAEGASYPATETIINTFRGTPYSTDMDIEKVNVIEESFALLQDKYLMNGQLSPKKMIINPMATRTNFPDNMLDYIFNIVADRESSIFLGLLSEIVRLRELTGNPPYCYPIYVGLVDQALLNVSTSDNFSQISPEFLHLVKGDYGLTPATIDPIFKDSIVRKDSTSLGSKLTLDDYKLRMQEKYNEQECDILTLIQLPMSAPAYFEFRTNSLYGVDGKNSSKEKQIHPI